MKRTSIRITDDDYKKIQAQAEKKSLLLADYLRYLIQLGLKVEEAAEKNHGERSPFLSIEEHILLWQTQLTWQRETCLLVKHLVDILTQAPMKDRDALMADAQEKAQARVHALLQPLQTAGS